jgi:hypothetical protein
MTPAEFLLEVAREFRFPKGRLIHPTPGVATGETVIHRIKLALKVADSPPALLFRMIVEEWPIDRIRREVY